MKLQGLLLLGLIAVAGQVAAQGCPNGIPAANNPGCIPPDDPQSPYYQAAERTQQLPQQPQPTGYWEKTWGAIAPSPVGGVLGTALGASSKEEAERLALEDCKAKGGGTCEVQIAYHNQCAVMIVGDKFLGTARAETIEKASDLGIRNCQSSDTNCQVYYSACTEPIFHRY